MKRSLILLVLTTCVFVSHAQGLKKIPISNSGCSLYTYCGMQFEQDYSQDSSLVYVGECVKDEVSYGVICVKLLQSTDNLDAAEETLVAYLDYLKGSFKIKKAAGYGKGHQLADNENTRGIIDYWEDADKNNWKIKGWTNGKFIGFMYCYSAKELNETRINIFLDGFRFPGM